MLIRTLIRERALPPLIMEMSLRLSEASRSLPVSAGVILTRWRGFGNVFAAKTRFGRWYQICILVLSSDV